MTIDVQRSPGMPEGRHACDDLAAEIEAVYRARPDIRFGVTLSLDLVRPKSVCVVYIRTLYKNRRHASAVMDHVVRAADRYDVTLDLDARAIREDGPRVAGLSQSALVAFYERRGFRAISTARGSTHMRRLAPSLRSRR